MSNGLRVLARVPNLSDKTRAALAGTEPRVPGFPEYLDVEHPRHSFLSDEIREQATEYAVADNQRVHRTFKKLEDALAARDNSKITFGVEEVEVPTAKQAQKAAAKADDSE